MWHTKANHNVAHLISQRPDSTFIQAGVPEKAVAHVLSQYGKQYALYTYGGGGANLQLRLSDGDYEAEWMHPFTGKYEKKVIVRSRNGKAIISSPVYQEDIALRLVRTF